jgi:SAM-dependent methyltransferase
MNAGPLANSYRWFEYAAFGPALEHARFDCLSYAAVARRILILGEGDGRFLARLLDRNRHASVDVVETSGRMIELARRRLTPAERSRVEFHHIDAVTDVLPNGRFDLVVSHFFLDCLRCPDAEELILKVNSLLCPGAIWLVSEFQKPPGRIRSLHARLWLNVMYSFFSLTTGFRASELPPYRKIIGRHGLIEIDYRERRFGLIRSQVWRKHQQSVGSLTHPPGS